jgi:hypothetical protein
MRESMASAGAAPPGLKICPSERCLAVRMPCFQHRQLPQFIQIANVLGNPQWDSKGAAARSSRPQAVQQSSTGREYLHAADGSSFCTDGDGVIAQMEGYANNGGYPEYR